MAAQRRGSVKVLVQPPKDSLEAMATLFCVADSVALHSGFGAEGDEASSGALPDSTRISGLRLATS